MKFTLGAISKNGLGLAGCCLLLDASSGFRTVYLVCDCFTSEDSDKHIHTRMKMEEKMVD